MIYILDDCKVILRTLIKVLNQKNWRLSTNSFNGNRVQINVSWFGKSDPFFIFHDAVFPPSLKIAILKQYKNEKRVFFIREK